MRISRKNRQPAETAEKNAEGGETNARSEEGKVREIPRGLTVEEIKRELRERRVSVVSYHACWASVYTVAAVLWLLPAVAEHTGWGFLGFFSVLPRVVFPVFVLVVGFGLVVVDVSLESQAARVRKSCGGLNDVDETVFLVREGPYRVVRHPGYLAELFLYPSLTVALSAWIPFTVLTVISWVMVIGMIVILMRVEDKLNTRKWGVEYQRYMREVPAINFIKGLWNVLRKDKTSEVEGDRD